MSAIVEEKQSVFERPLLAAMALDWDRILFIVILALGILTRLWDLPYRAWNHDEAIHTDWSWNLYTGRGYQHNPIYHGPFLYHFTALTFFLFGDNDVTGRLPNAFFGMILVALPFFFRKWLGTKGALATMAMLLISPVVMYYSRFNRHDIYTEVFVVLMALAIWKYFDEGRELWLYASALLLSFSFTSMETTFIFAAVFAVFLCGHFTYHYVRSHTDWSPLRVALFASILGIPFLGFFILYQVVRSLRGAAEGQEEFREIPSFDLAMVFATFSLPLLSPAAIYALNPIWQRLSQTDFFPIAAFTEVNTLTSVAQSQPDVMLRVILLTVGFILASVLLGMWWNTRRWMICALLFWPVFVVFFTTVFTNGGGFFTGLLGSLGYWLSQQPVARGGQPSYYYLLVMLPEYEFLPYLLGLGMIFWYWWSFRRSFLPIIIGWILWIVGYYVAVRPLLLGVLANSASGPGIAEQLVVAFIAVLIPLTFLMTFDPDDRAGAFPTFVFTWVAGVLVIFSWAGEKMPWLTMHLTIPLAFASGLAVERLLNVNWKELFSRGAAWLALLIPLALVILVMLGTNRPFQGMTLEQLSATNGFIVALLLLLGVVTPALYLIGRRFTTNEILRVSVVTLVVVMAALTIRFAWMAVYINPDVAVETIIYAQGSHDTVTAMQEIENLSRRLCAQVVIGKPQNLHCDNGTIKVAYDDDSSWPFVWYLRNYRNAQYYGASPGSPFDAEVVIVGPKNEEAVRPLLGTKYLRRDYKLIWWPLEGYKDLTLARVLDYIREPEMRSQLFTAWFYHKYNESQSQWPYVHNFAFYVRKDVAAMLWNYAPNLPGQPGVEDEYEKKKIQLPAARPIGSGGQANGQFNYPRNVATDSQGNLYVVDSENNRIQKFDSSGKFLLAWGTKSPDVPSAPPGTLNQPWGIAVDQAGNVFVADTWNHRIQKFDATGKFISMWGSVADTRGNAQTQLSQFYGPRSIAIDPQGNVYVTDTGNKRVLKFNSNGEPIAGYGGVGSEDGQFQEPVGLAFDKEGNVYVADTWNQRIQKFDPSFKYLTQWHVEAWETQTVVNKPYLAVDADANVFLTDPEASRIIKFSSDGKLLSVFGDIGTDLSSFNLPTGLAFDHQGNLYVADSGNQRILMFAKP